MTESKEQTPLETKLSILADDIGYFGAIVAVTIFLFMAFNLLYSNFQKSISFFSLYSL